MAVQEGAAMFTYLYYKITYNGLSKKAVLLYGVVLLSM